MDTHCIPLSRTGTLPPLVEDLLKDPASLDAFYSFPPTLEGYDEAIDQRNLDEARREQLVERLRSQYKKDEVPLRAELEEKVQALSDPNTFTVTSGHQLCLFTGPLLTIHKILHSIRLAEELEKRHPDKRFVPVHWMASEDHDRAEIDHAFIDGETFKWETEQEGAVGRMKPEGLSSLIEKLRKRKEGLPYGEEWTQMLEEAYLGSQNWSQATRKLLDNLFGDRGLVILDGDDTELKKSLVKDLEKEFSEGRSTSCVERTNDALKTAGYGLQVHNRPINLFYLTEQYRERIEPTSEGFATADGKKHWTQEEVLNEVRAHPERFSPNVIMRPLYQERILPNVAYIGGPAEVAYWHQLKGFFDTAEAFFPLLQVRSQIFHFDQKTAETMERIGMESEELFKGYDELVRERIKASSDRDLELQEEEERLKTFYEMLAEKASGIDPNLWDSTMAEHRKAQKGLDRLRKKMVRHAKKHEDILLGRIQRILERSFPNGTQQERRVNITEFYAREGKAFLKRSADAIQPFRADAILIVEKQA